MTDVKGSDNEFGTNAITHRGPRSSSQSHDERQGGGGDPYQPFQPPPPPPPLTPRMAGAQVEPPSRFDDGGNGGEEVGPKWIR